MSYTQEQIDRANQVNLEEFLRSQGEQLIKSGSEWRWKRHDSMTVKGNKWFRHSQSKGGYPVEFVMEFFGKSFPEAVELLIGEAPVNKINATSSSEFRLPPRSRYMERAMAYLRQRNIPEELVQEFCREGLIYEDAQHHNIVFVGKDAAGIPRYAHCKGTSDGFRMDVLGSDKAHNFACRSDGKSLFVFEAPIDLVRSLLFIGKVKADPTTRVIVHEKSSLAPPGQSLAFSLGDEKGFRWIGAYDISAEDLLAGGEGSKTELKQEQAAKLIEDFLSDGGKASIAEINKEAAERGISERTVRLARNSMGDKIASERQGKDWWIWFKK